MAVEDLWTRKDGSPSTRYGRGLRWRVRWPGVPARSFRTKGEAERHWLRVRTEVATPPEQLVTVDTLVDRWLATKAGLSPKGYEACAGAARHVRERWGHEIANNIARHDVEVWLASLPYGSSLRGKILQCMSGSFKTLPAIGNPCEGVRVRQEQKREPRFLSMDELYEVAEKAGEHYAPMVLFLGTAGVRIGECVALDVRDVDKERGRVRVWKSRKRKATKGSRARDVPIPAPVLDMLSLDREKSAPLFLTPMGKRPLVDNWRARVFNPAAEACGFDMTVHDLRHTAASLAIAAGADIKSVQAMLGHKTGQLTIDLYGHLFDRNLDDVAARMGAAMGTHRVQQPITPDEGSGVPGPPANHQQPPTRANNQDTENGSEQPDD